MTHIPTYIPTQLSVEADYLSQDWMIPEWHLLPQVAQAAFYLWGLPEVDLLVSSHSTQALLHLGISTTSGGLWVECLQPSLDVSGKLCVSSSCISSSNSVQVSDGTCQRSTDTFDSDGTMLDGGSLTPHSPQHVGRCFSAVPLHKRSHHGCLGRPGTQGSAISAFNPLVLRDVCYTDKGSFPQSVRE